MIKFSATLLKFREQGEKTGWTYIEVPVEIAQRLKPNNKKSNDKEVLDLSTLNNKAYQVLSNPKKSLKYVLELKGIVETDEGYQLPQSFLMDMMDVNEALMDLEFEPDAEKLKEVRNNVDSIEKDLEHELNQLINQFDQNPLESEIMLVSIKDIFYRQKYINRIREKLPKI